MRTTILLILTALVLSGCSGTRLAYNNPDWWGPWVARDYVRLDREQRSLMRSELRQWQRDHCAEAMPEYARWVNEVRIQWQQHPPSLEQLERWQQDLTGALDQVMASLSSPSARLLVTLSDEQIDELFENLDDRHQALAEEYTEPDTETQIRERQDRVEERAERWLGPLSDSQRERIAQWSTDRADQNAHWLENRRRWQLAFRDVLEQRQADSFPENLDQALRQPERFHTDEWQTRQAQAQAETLVLIRDLLQLSDERQRRHFDRELRDLSELLQSLSCQTS